MMVRQSFEGRKEIAKFLAITKQLQQTYAIPRPQLGSAFNNTAELNIVYSTKQFQLYPNAFDDSYKFVGPSIGSRPDDSTFPFDELENERIIYISLGTVFNDKPDLYRLCLDAFVDLKYRVVMSVGSKIDIANLGTIPTNFIVKSFVPQLQLLQHAALFVTHGGMNSISEGCVAGVPFLMLPQAADQSSIARRIPATRRGKNACQYKSNYPKPQKNSRRDTSKSKVSASKRSHRHIIPASWRSQTCR